ncbi:hypothetical protein [Methanobrevibacter sp.]|uniref:hypothetical protein n=1 Tax=Methanobrevibacter sp. TaxID=66852 RepID=UPI0025FD6B71|nr:hypothetical protein [Methanobrevibacter sp.]MBR4448311.1 hypothetical protein [Methanobrevibacter sp.]
MKLKLTILSIIILTIISLSCVSAADNSTAISADESIVCDNPISVNTDENAVPDVSAGVSDEINVTFDEMMWEQNLTDINVELPEDASGDFCIKIDDEVIYNQTITEKSFKVPVKLPKRFPEFVITIYPPVDCRQYTVSAFYNGIDLNLTAPLKIMKYPPDYSLLHFPDEIVQNDNNYLMLAFPRSANGIVEFYIDDKLFNRTTVRPTFSWDNAPFSKLSLGNHTLRVHYLGDKYYNAFNKTFNFTVVNVRIDIPKVVNIGHDDCISVKTLKKYTGTVKVYIDNKLVKTSKTQNGEYILSLEEYIKYTNHEIKVVYSGSDFSRTKTQSVNMTYDFDVWPMYLTYGEDSTIEVILPDTLNRKLLTITIDGVKYKFTQPKNSGNNMAAVDVSKLGAGNHSMVVSFAGDDKFYSLTRTYNFTVNYEFMIPTDIEYKDSSKIYLKLPSNANGALVVYVDGKLFKSSKLNNGYAEVKIGKLAPGNHNITVKYDGKDYNLSDEHSSVYVAPKISLTYFFRAGENKYISVEVPKDCKGYVIFNIDGKDHKVAIKDGIAKFSLKKLKVGEHDIYVSYYGNNGVEDLDNWRVVTVSKQLVKLTLKKVKVKKSAKKLVIKATLKINKKAVKGKKLTFKFKGKKYTAKTNKKGIAKITIKKNVLKKLKVGKKVKYQVKYGKKVVKKTAKVKK